MRARKVQYVTAGIVSAVALSLASPVTTARAAPAPVDEPPTLHSKVVEDPGFEGLPKKGKLVYMGGNADGTGTGTGTGT